MLAPFFSLAMTAPNRHKAFRVTVGLHLGLVACIAGLLALNPGVLPIAVQGLLVAGIVEGALLLGWRLTQLPKSQALEFMLVSPLQPRPLYRAEALVGLSRLTLVALSGTPILLALAGVGRLQWADVPVLVLMPLTWGTVCGLGLTCWAYESKAVRRFGERLGLVGVIGYLLIGVLAGENLRQWLAWLPGWASHCFMELYGRFHTYNPFAVLQYWFDTHRNGGIALERMFGLEVVGVVTIGVAVSRGAARLRGHFHDRHYRPLTEQTPADPTGICDRPLSWWAVRRVMEYSGRVNIYLAGGFGLLYAAYTLAGDAWPPWMGRLIFQIVESVGGIPALAAGMVVLASVPACFQYGLWDSTAQDRCRRLELLLLTDLRGADYAHAALAAAWRRGRGYAAVSLVLIAAAAIARRTSPANAVTAVIAGVSLWASYFALGFRGFARGRQANGLGSLLTLGVPTASAVLAKTAGLGVAALTPPGAIYVALAGGPGAPVWCCIGVQAFVTVWVGRTTARHCDRDLRAWYDANHGRKVAD